MSAPKGNKNHLKHGMRHTRIYNIWRAMRQRCSNPKCINYKNYGGKGVQVCTEWEDFQTFYDWAMLNGYAEYLTIDRVDVNGNYEPSNCRWVSYKVQANNKRNSKFLELNGVSHTIAEWGDITGIPKGTIWLRLKKGWSVERAITEPIGGQHGKSRPFTHTKSTHPRLPR
jgi:hypothetical protein